MSTVTGLIKNPDSSAFTGQVRFIPLSTPYSTGSMLIATTDIVEQCDSTGAFSTVLRRGRYRVAIGTTTRTFVISVPDDSDTHAIDGLIETDTTPDTEATYYTAAQCDERFAPAAGATYYTVYNPDLGDFCRIRIRGLGTGESPYNIEILDPE